MNKIYEAYKNTTITEANKIDKLPEDIKKSFKWAEASIISFEEATDKILILTSAKFLNQSAFEKMIKNSGSYKIIIQYASKGLGFIYSK